MGDGRACWDERRSQKDAADHYIFIHSFLLENSIDFGNSTKSHPHETVQKNTGANGGFPVHNSERRGNEHLLSEMGIMSATVHVPEGTLVGGRVLFPYTVNAEGRRRSFGYFVSLKFARRNAWFHLDSVDR